jgi:hypothetical protein
VIHNTQCSPDPYISGATDCYTTQAEENTTTSSSGGESTQINGTVTLTITDSTGNVLYTATESLHYHTLYQNGVLQEGGAHVSYTYGTSCYSEDIHVANGNVQYDTSSSSC